jgi:beta-galactosidase
MSRKLATIAVMLYAIVLADAARGAESPRVRQTNDFGWRFARGDQPGAEAAGFDDAQWQPVDLPHDWSIDGPFDTTNNPRSEGALPAGMGWYRKVLNFPADYRGRRIFLEFDGIYENGSVFVNGKLAGKRPYGYSSVCYDVTSLVNVGNDNTIAVQVDNTHQPNSRWYPGSGIYRHTYLIVTDGLHIPQWGTYVTTPMVSRESASINVQVKVRNLREAAAQYELESTLLDKDGREVAAARSPGRMDAGAEATANQQMTLPNPNLWSINEPNMYTVRTVVRAGGVVVDQCETPIGIRKLEYDLNKGLLINGEHVKLNGVCLHSDGGPVGVAVPDGVWIRRLKILKEMGCNSIRWSHAPPDPNVLDLCDQMGITVMDEAFDQWRQGKNRNDYSLYFDQWWERDLTDFVRRDRNHPSVVMWSAGNEIHNEQTQPEGWKVLKGIVDVFHREDPLETGGRPVTSACDNMHAQPTSTTLEFVNLLDVAGYNYVDRWGDFAYLYYAPDRFQYPTRKFIGTEDTSMGGTRGAYGDPFAATSVPSTQPAPSAVPATGRGPVAGAGRGGFGGFGFGPRNGGAPSINVENLWKAVRGNDYVIGDYMWTGIDYLGEGVPGATSGVIDRCGFPKDSYYFYQSQWTSKPMVHIFPTWTWPGREGQTLTVYAYSNCDSVQLFVNDKPYANKSVAKYPTPGRTAGAGRGGRGPAAAGTTRAGGAATQGAAGARGGGFGRGAAATTGDLHLSWDVPYEPGTLKAVGMSGGQVVATDIIYTTGEPTTLGMQLDKTTATADGRDVIHVVIRLLDAKGHLVTATPAKGNPLVHFSVAGPAKIIGVDNGSSSIEEGFKADQRTTSYGMCLAILQTTRAAGPIHVTARAEGFQDVSADIDSK